MLRLLLLFFIPMALFSSQVKNLRWDDGETYLMFLQRLNLSNKPLYYNLDKDDKQITEEIRTGVNYQILEDANGTIEQILIPVNDELQIHITKNKDDLGFEVIPIISETRKEAFTLEINNSPYYDIIKATNSKKIAQIFVEGFKNSLNFKVDVHKGDKLVMIYDRMYRLGRPFSMPTLDVSMIQLGKKRHYVYRYTDDRFYDEKGAEVEGFLLARPVRGARISSGFTLKRWHPILHKYRAHLGIDYAARPGTPIMAAGSGRIIFCGRTNGYGNLIKIAHGDGYVTLYAHQKAFRHGIRRGKYVKQGQIIGYVGTTGLSTGPHLHFGLYKDGRAINPARVVRVTTNKLKGKDKVAFEKLKENLNQSIDLYLKANTKPIALGKYEPVYYVDKNGNQIEPKKEQPVKVNQ
ncbi:peptidoglycan DD-metalloendopeptidase family protein [Sulfurimonas sp. HSL-1716]|uniref:peptidoglycan DD-metalloendopeptidase family protein n=1 Tax=Hydrocurvibacter sulfurireducens TaxID=3131937 RepID=UPI0031F96304